MENHVLERLQDLCKRCVRIQQPVFSTFLDPAGCALAKSCSHEAGAAVRLWGGYEDAERRIACFYDAAGYYDDIVWPLKSLEIRWNSQYHTLTHRDILGSLMGQGIKREALGDILLSEGQAICFLHEMIADYICLGLDRVGKAKVTCSIVPIETVILPEKQYRDQTVMVASLRLDAVIAAVYGFSRSTAADAIRSGMIKVDHLPILRTDFPVKSNCVLSCRQRGRVHVRDICGQTRHGRIKLNVQFVL